MSKNVLIIGHVWPEPKSSAAGSRMLQLIDLFLNDGYTITFACANNKTDNAFDLSTKGVTEASIKLNHSSFDEFVKTLESNIVIFDRFMTEEQFGWRVAEHCPDALRILDTEDLHGLRKGRAEALKAKQAFSTEFLLNDTTKRELASIYRCDISLIISEVELQLLKDNLKLDDALLHYLPFLLEHIEPETIAALPKFEERQHFISIGNFLHQPNYDAVLYLKETIWPLIRRQLPKAELHIYGAYSSQKVEQLHNAKEGFLIKGFAEDVHKVMQQATVCLAPLRFGAGLKGKLVDAMQNGTPCVMSSIAAEGMFKHQSRSLRPLEVNGFIADNPEAFAKSAVDLYTNKRLWTAAQHTGFRVLNERFNVNSFKADFLATLQQTTTHLKKYRQNNITGQVLQHHTLQSTKYMSKWIEEKNKD